MDGFSLLRAEIAAHIIDRRTGEQERPGRFWGDCGRTLSQAERGDDIERAGIYAKRT